MTIIEFLEARIAEDEAQAYNVLVFRMIPGTGMPGNQAIPARVLAECAAKRAIIAAAEPASWMDNHAYGGYTDAMDVVISALAAIYADHPDYPALENIGVLPE